MTDLLRSSLTYYDASYPPDILGGGTPGVPNDPHITSINPTSGEVDVAATITVVGRDFEATSVVEGNGAALTTTFVNVSHLSATFTPAAEGVMQISVRNADDAESNNVPFTVTAPTAQEAAPAEEEAVPDDEPVAEPVPEEAPE